ncbi:MAG: hypothetical protein KAJ06_05990, partial [Gammaproteobacteria bacterium]|nr:hypothetical protein [Gammaproteobacteria bacterium]
MYKTLIVALIVLFAGNAAANPNDCELHQIDGTWYFETTQTGLVHGTYNYQAFANGASSAYQTLEFASAAAPDITSHSPATQDVSNEEEDTREFSVTANQPVNATWYINGSEVQYNSPASTGVAYTNTSAVLGYWNVSVVVNNTNGDDMQTWWWTVAPPGFSTGNRIWEAGTCGDPYRWTAQSFT